MKRGTPDHPKLRDLAKTLRINEAWAVGLLEMLFHATARYAPCGNIGKASDEWIAMSLAWPRRKAPQLIAALIDTGWLDRDPDHRLLVHDWDQHADQSVRKTLKNRGEDFIRPTRDTWIYFVRAMPSDEIKIGFTARPRERFSELQMGTTEKLELLGIVKGGFNLEESLHNRFKSQRIRGEWHKNSPELLLIIKELTSRITGNVPSSMQEEDQPALALALALASPEPGAGASSGSSTGVAEPPPKTPPARSNGHRSPKPERSPLQTNGLAPPDAIDWHARYEGVYALYPLPGWKPEGQMRYVSLIAEAVDPHATAAAIDRSVLEWAAFWKANQAEHVPGIGKWFSDGYYLRKPSPNGRRKEPTMAQIAEEACQLPKVK